MSESEPMRGTTKRRPSRVTLPSDPWQRAMVQENDRLRQALKDLLPVAEETCKRWPNDDVFLIPTARAREVIYGKKGGAHERRR